MAGIMQPAIGNPGIYPLAWLMLMYFLAGICNTFLRIVRHIHNAVFSQLTTCTMLDRPNQVQKVG